MIFLLDLGDYRQVQNLVAAEGQARPLPLPATVVVMVESSH
jgi:hypothetical protein